MLGVAIVTDDPTGGQRFDRDLIVPVGCVQIVTSISGCSIICWSPGPAGQLGWRLAVSVHDSATTESLPADPRRGRIWAWWSAVTTGPADAPSTLLFVLDGRPQQGPFDAMEAWEQKPTSPATRPRLALTYASARTGQAGRGPVPTAGPRPLAPARARAWPRAGRRLPERRTRRHQAPPRAPGAAGQIMCDATSPGAIVEQAGHGPSVAASRSGHGGVNE
jgi:hypothetical protein